VNTRPAGGPAGPAAHWQAGGRRGRFEFVSVPGDKRHHDGTRKIGPTLGRAISNGLVTSHNRSSSPHSVARALIQVSESDPGLYRVSSLVPFRLPASIGPESECVLEVHAPPGVTLTYCNRQLGGDMHGPRGLWASLPFFYGPFSRTVYVSGKIQLL
jgi:hypothetical protein